MTAPVQAVADVFRLTSPPLELTPRFNIAPTQKVAVVVQQAGTANRKLGPIRWGLVPSWANSPAGPPLVNARGETVDRLPCFRESFESRRCLIPASGFFEWVRREKL